MSHTGNCGSQLIRRLIFVGLATFVALSGFSPLALAQNVTVRVSILEVKNLSVSDGCCDEVDWYTIVTIAGEEFDNEDTAEQDALEGNDHIFPNT